MRMTIMADSHAVKGGLNQDGHRIKKQSFKSFALITYFYLNLDFEAKTTYVAGC